MNAPGIKSGFAFSRNPIVIRETYTSGQSDPSGGRFSVSMSGTKLYEGRFFPPLNVDISEILESSIGYVSEPPEGNTSPFRQIENSTKFGLRTVKVSAEYGNSQSEYQFWIVRGGISNQNYRQLYNLNQDVFRTRFLNQANNFFMTTRTSSWRIVLKETELYPLYFFVIPGRYPIEVLENVTGSSYSTILTGPGVYVLDVDALRKWFFDRLVLASRFDIRMGGRYSCQVVIEKSDIRKDRFRLKFRNSLGVFEIVEITGAITESSDYSGSEETFSRLDPVTGSFYSDRARSLRKGTLKVETGFKGPDEMGFLQDMIGSEEVYLLDMTDYPLKVIPSVENLSFRQRPEGPEKFTLNLEIAETESNVTRDIIDGNEARRPRLFSKQFSNQFN